MDAFNIKTYIRYLLLSMLSFFIWTSSYAERRIGDVGGDRSIGHVDYDNVYHNDALPDDNRGITYYNSENWAAPATVVDAPVVVNSCPTVCDTDGNCDSSCDN